MVTLADTELRSGYSGELNVVPKTETDHDLHLMTSLTPEMTGLPFVVWIGQKGHASYDARVRVSRTGRGDTFLAVASVHPKVEIVLGEIDPPSLALLKRWVELNSQVILEHWDGAIPDSFDALDALVPLETASP